ncbi:MAG: hypothetical protein NT033_09725, partial [Candidatus Omnitrophica bacterium]|nr:hypothetical protein [Candidatus Omnitrophota bacterium]
MTDNMQDFTACSELLTLYCRLCRQEMILRENAQYLSGQFKEGWSPYCIDAHNTCLYIKGILSKIFLPQEGQKASPVRVSILKTREGSNLSKDPETEFIGWLSEQFRGHKIEGQIDAAGLQEQLLDKGQKERDVALETLACLSLDNCRAVPLRSLLELETVVNYLVEEDSRKRFFIYGFTPKVRQATFRLRKDDPYWQLLMVAQANLARVIAVSADKERTEPGCWPIMTRYYGQISKVCGIFIGWALAPGLLESLGFVGGVYTLLSWSFGLPFSLGPPQILLIFLLLSAWHILHLFKAQDKSLAFSKAKVKISAITLLLFTFSLMIQSPYLGMFSLLIPHIIVNALLVSFTELMFFCNACLYARAKDVFGRSDNVRISEPRIAYLYELGTFPGFFMQGLLDMTESWNVSMRNSSAYYLDGLAKIHGYSRAELQQNSHEVYSRELAFWRGESLKPARIIVLLTRFFKWLITPSDMKVIGLLVLVVFISVVTTIAIKWFLVSHASTAFAFAACSIIVSQGSGGIEIIEIEGEKFENPDALKKELLNMAFERMDLPRKTTFLCCQPQTKEQWDEARNFGFSSALDLKTIAEVVETGLKPGRFTSSQKRNLFTITFDQPIPVGEGSLGQLTLTPHHRLDLKQLQEALSE